MYLIIINKFSVAYKFNVYKMFVGLNPEILCQFLIGVQYEHHLFIYGTFVTLFCFIFYIHLTFAGQQHNIINILKWKLFLPNLINQSDRSYIKFYYFYLIIAKLYIINCWFTVLLFLSPYSWWIFFCQFYICGKFV